MAGRQCFRNLDMFLSFSQGRTDAAIRAVQAARSAQNPEQRPEFMYLGAIGGMLTGAPEWSRFAEAYIRTGYAYADYIRLMKYAYAGGRRSASERAELGARWAQIHPESWADRMRNGDISVWREMLIGRFQGAVPDSQIFEILESEDAWQKSDFAYLPVSRPRF